MTGITIYTKPNCVQCDATKREFTKRNVPYKETPITEDLLDDFRAKGYAQAPVVEVSGAGKEDSWAGFRIDKIKEWATILEKGE